MEFLKAHVEGVYEAEVEYSWVGYLGIGDMRDPIVKTVAPGLHVGVRMGGMGVAIGGLVGQELAGLVS
jgi:glycine/D-amino acid oxidase-like deaminating enzyme